MFADRVVSTVEMHTGGAPFRIVTSGAFVLRGKTIVARREWLPHNGDEVRRSLTLEPRGHADMYLGILTAPISSDADFGVIFAHNEGYSDHCVIALSTAAVLLGWVERVTPITKVVIDAPCSRIEAFAEWDGTTVGKVNFVNVPSFVWKAAANLAYRVVHEDIPELNHIYGTIITGELRDAGSL